MEKLCGSLFEKKEKNCTVYHLSRNDSNPFHVFLRKIVNRDNLVSFILLSIISMHFPYSYECTYPCITLPVVISSKLSITESHKLERQR